MKRILVGVTVLIGIIALLLSLSRLSQSQSYPVVENSVTRLSSVLESSTQVPVALPSSVPFSNYFSSLGDVDADNYQINIEADGECQGISNCRLGSVSGKVASLQTVSDEFGNDESIEPVAKSSNSQQSVVLLNGIQGMYFPWVCGANCSSSKIVWGQDGYRYVVALQARTVSEDQELQTLIQMANSAISNRK